MLAATSITTTTYYLLPATCYLLPTTYYLPAAEILYQDNQGTSFKLAKGPANLESN